MQRAADDFLRLGQFLFFRQHRSQVEIGLGVIRLQADGLALGGNRLVVPPERFQKIAQIVMDLRLIRLGGERLAIKRLGFIHAAL